MWAHFAVADTASPGGVTILDRLESARSKGCGGGTVAIGGDTNMLWSNPAGCAWTAGPTIALTGNRGYYGDYSSQGIANLLIGDTVASIGAAYYDAGTVSQFTSQGDMWTRDIQQDWMVAAGYAGRLTSGVSSGATVKYIRGELFEFDRYQLLVGDMGVQANINQVAKVGIAILNIGHSMSPGPRTGQESAVLRGGVALGWQFDGLATSARDYLVVMADCGYQVSDRGNTYHGGLEYQWGGIVVIRCGALYGTPREASVASLGLGIKAGIYRLDWAMRYSDALDSPQTVSLTIPIGHR